MWNLLGQWIVALRLFIVERGGRGRGSTAKFPKINPKTVYKCIRTCRMNDNYWKKNLRKTISPAFSLPSINPYFLQLGAQEYTCELILGNKLGLSNIDLIESLETWVVKCYKEKNCPSNVSTIPQNNSL